MAGKTTIEWTAMPGFAPAVWNPTTGCTRVSAGCDNCYAFALHDKRFATNLHAAEATDAGRSLVGRELIAEVRRSGYELPWPKQYDLPFSHVQLLEERLGVPLRTKKPTCYFVDSMADLFHEDVPTEFVGRVFNVMGNATQHRFLILTKRPERMRAVMRAYYEVTSQQPFANVWLGTSVEDQASADERIPHLLETPAAVRFLSCEPLLGPLHLQRALAIYQHRGEPCHVEVDGWHRLGDGSPGSKKWHHERIDWVIVGGESGPRARPMDLQWARSLRDQCAAAGVSFFMKQLGSKPVVDGVSYSMLSGHKLEAHGRDTAQWPEDLGIRTWPR